MCKMHMKASSVTLSQTSFLMKTENLLESLGLAMDGFLKI